MDYTGDMQPGNIPLGLALGMAMNENAIIMENLQNMRKSRSWQKAEM